MRFEIRSYGLTVRADSVYHQTDESGVWRIKLVELIATVRDEPEVTQEALAARFGVTTRTVRSRVQRANEWLDDVARIKLRRGAGYTIVTTNPARLDALLAPPSLSSVPDHPSERRIFLFVYLLTVNSWVKLRDVSTMLFVTRATLSYDLERLESRYSAFGLRIETRPRYGLRVAGDEVMRRLCLAAVLTEYGRELQSAVVRALSCALANQMEPQETYRAVRDCLHEAAGRYRVRFNTQTVDTLYTHVLVMCVRARLGAGLDEAGKDAASIRQFASYPLACDMVAELSDRLHVDFGDGEAVFLATQLGGRLILDDAYRIEHDQAKLMRRVRAAADEIAKRMRDEFAIDIMQDKQSFDQLLAYLAPLSARLRYHVEVRSTADPTFQERYRLAFALARMAARVIERRLAGAPSEAEVRNLAVMFALMLTRRGQVPGRRRVLVVYHQGPMTGRFLASRVRYAFSNYIESMACMSVSEFERDGCPCQDGVPAVDVIVATVPLKAPTGVPTLVVNALLNDEDTNALAAILQS